MFIDYINSVTGYFYEILKCFDIYHHNNNCTIIQLFGVCDDRYELLNKLISYNNIIIINHISKNIKEKLFVELMVIIMNNE